MNQLKIGVDYPGILLNNVDETGWSMVTYPAELTDNPEILDLIAKVRKLYREQFIDNKYEFAYIGFQSQEAEHEYIKAVYQFYVLFKQEMEGKYHVTIGDYFINEYHKIMKD